MKASSFLFFMAAMFLAGMVFYDKGMAKVSLDTLGVVFAIHICSAFIAKTIEDIKG